MQKKNHFPGQWTLVSRSEAPSCVQSEGRSKQGNPGANTILVSMLCVSVRVWERQDKGKRKKTMKSVLWGGRKGGEDDLWGAGRRERVWSK